MNTRVVAASALLIITLLQLPAWGGGWSSSGGPSRAPSPIFVPTDLPGYNCSIMVAGALGTVDVYSEQLESKHFVHGVARIVTPAFKGKQNVEGHELTFYGSPPNQTPMLNLRLKASIRTQERAIAQATVFKSVPAEAGSIMVDVHLESPVLRKSVTVTARCSK